jgi:hypothetical protein
MVAAYQAQTPVLTTLGIMALPQLEEVLVDQPNDVEAIDDDHGAGEVLTGNLAIGCGQIHHDDADLFFAGQSLQVAAQAGFRAPRYNVEHLAILQIDQCCGIALLATEEVFVDTQHLRAC